MATRELISSLRSTLGASFLGAMGSAMLFGVTNLQIYFYFRTYKQDGLCQKCTVVYLWLLDTSQMAFVIIHLWHYLIESFGNAIALQYVNWSYRLQMTLTLVVIASVQSLYTWRVWILSRQENRFWPYITTIILTCVYASGAILMFQTYTTHTFAELTHVHWSVYVAFAMCTFADVVLTIAMCHLLYLGRIGSAETRSIVGIVVRYIIASGALTSMTAIAGLVTFCTMPNNSISLGIALVLTKVYINSFLALLNARKNIRSLAADANMNDIDGRVRITDIDSGVCTEETAGVYVHHEKVTDMLQQRGQNSFYSIS